MSENTYKTEQELFWAGEFGDKYIGRNKSEKLLASNVAFFGRALGRVTEITSCIEFGANVGMNLKALDVLYPGISLDAIEINEAAARELDQWMSERPNDLGGGVHNCSLHEWEPKLTADLVLIKTVLIHINPEYLKAVYEKLYKATSRYILIAEYYNPSPVTVSYRGHNERLYKRDFAGEILDTYNDLRLVDYGFVYKRDPVFPQDDINWFLLEKITV